ncbi:MAG TPA: hypothetical protein VLD37_03005 [Candidatus Bilamarchaeum sp.]|nr:hypothetical protein [Candidatus Bilamarchaeum sp.]
MLTVISLLGIGYSLHSCDPRLQFLAKDDVNVTYVGNDTIIVVKNMHLHVVTEPPPEADGANYSVLGKTD